MTRRAKTVDQPSPTRTTPPAPTPAPAGKTAPTPTGKPAGIPSPKNPIVSDEEIRVRAYQKWEAAGRPAGDGMRFWLEAERELKKNR
jgi:hypothetical protein